MCLGQHPWCQLIAVRSTGTRCSSLLKFMSNERRCASAPSVGSIVHKALLNTDQGCVSSCAQISAFMEVFRDTHVFLRLLVHTRRHNTAAGAVSGRCWCDVMWCSVVQRGQSRLLNVVINSVASYANCQIIKFCHHSLQLSTSAVFSEGTSRPLPSQWWIKGGVRKTLVCL